MSEWRIDLECMRLPVSDQLERGLQGIGPVVALFVCK